MQHCNADGSCKPALMSKVAAQTFLSWATDSPLASKLLNLLPFFIYLSFPLRVCVCDMHVCAYMCKSVCDLVHVQALRLMSRIILND